MFRLCVFLSCLVFDAATQGLGLGERYGVQDRASERDAFTHNVHSNKEIWSSKDKNPVVCSLRDIFTTTARPVATTPRLGTTTTEYIPPVYDYQPIIPEVEGCGPLRSYETAAKNGQKARDSCIDYHEQLIRPCQRSVALLGGLARANNCMHKDGVFVGSTSVLHDEASHVALLGYKFANDSMLGRCTGTLLSDQFILTSAQCNFGETCRCKSYAMVGSRKGIDSIDAPQIHGMQSFIRHPEYDAKSGQNDIALFKTKTRITLDQWTVPACLDVFGGEYSKAIAMSWSTRRTDIVKRVSLNHFAMKQCLSRLRDERGMKFNLNSKTQICYGNYTSNSNIDQTDTGGPLVIKNPRIQCMYSVVGVMSLAQRFKSNFPGVFTKVAHYVSWIESVVWP